MNRHEHIGRFQHLLADEHDSCGIVAVIEKDGNPTYQNMQDAIDALVKMEHRSGFALGEGDGTGLLTDLPRALWSQKISLQGKNADFVNDDTFVVAHIFIPKTEHATSIQASIRQLFDRQGFFIMHEELDHVHSHVLGNHARSDEPHFWQIALQSPQVDEIERLCFDLAVQLEEQFPIHISSLSNRTVVYKAMGAANLLPKYYEDLTNIEFKTAASIGHNRYSTNTLSNFSRVQPFSLLGHNGEINTISKLRDEAHMLDIPITSFGSDSQDLNRTIETLIHHHQFSLFEAIEMVFPVIKHEIEQLPLPLQNLYTYYRRAWGPFAQGPAGIVSRYGDECAFSVDALGLRPLWLVESNRSFYFSSEQGVIPVHQMVREPKPLAPGETIGVTLTPQPQILEHHELQQIVLQRCQQRINLHQYFASTLEDSGTNLTKPQIPALPQATDQAYAAFGWDREHIQMVEQMADTGSDPIRSLGHDGPLACLADSRQNIPDFIKESVAVVTNPAIDREREQEHFSTRVYLGRRPSLQNRADQHALDQLELPSPLLIEGPHASEVVTSFATLSYEQVFHYFFQRGQVATLSLTYSKEETIPERLDALAREAEKAVIAGMTCLIFSDEGCHTQDRLFLDPHLAISKVDQSLKLATVAQGEDTLRRRTSLVLRSSAIRNLHDIAIALGLGADAISPSLMFASIADKEEKSETQLFEAINKGLEKILSTIGIHELRGYARLFSAIGLHQEVADVLQIVNYAGTNEAGRSWDDFHTDALMRYEDYHKEKVRPARTFHAWPRLWKPLTQVAAGTLDYQEFATKLTEIEEKTPISLRHVLDLKNDGPTTVTPDSVDLSIGDHAFPFAISSMSFGSQGEIPFRAYAEAADRLNMVSLNGEGGEIKDMLGKYPRTRGHQIASGRFGVNVELANSANILEIKIGQGAKPGEGGHLPGKKVSAKVAAARNANTGVDLISPSNNHDIYSIEDLAQIITELKTANNKAKVIVKVPIVPNIGTIAVGIAKAGADIITLSGFDGGTGAARIHALQHVGLPAEIGVKAAHTALVEANLRTQVEIWADGGVKSGLDVIKLILLGANRIGFGTLAMMAIGCTACRGCHLDTCHVGIATQIESEEEAKEHGLRRFVPRQSEAAVQGLMTLFTALGSEVQRLTAQLGFERTQDLVGRSDLLVQKRALTRLSLDDLLHPTPDTWKELDGAEVAATTIQSDMLIAAGGEAEATLANSVVIEAGGTYAYAGAHCAERVLVSSLSGARVRNRLDGSYRKLPETNLQFTEGSVPGNGFSSFQAEGMNVIVQGGAQDGVGKTSFGGRVSILKSPNANGQLINGSVGKSFCYGAQKGLFIVQGNADSRAGIRLSGADIIIGGQIEQPLTDSLGMIGNRANIKGFAFEYMTEGRAVVLGDPGPWICAGMTGGVVYLRLQPELGLDEEALQRRIAKGAKVSLQPLSAKGKEDLNELLTLYIQELGKAEQAKEAEKITALLTALDSSFLQVIPDSVQADPSISTE
ncbi:glutamate synthase-related protein [Mechercharimyces sp. CAU 1602]|uniref:glutamate synthase-related protein n=1 Tax=Mechercharimyces sp. CAU 1602 TaxID=2973933 RepID=UPI0021611E48|nr:glutamate synthase-related protein [Mechercharimyces sp. CAU 1602]MCS1352773.1 glutamate synthase-related protein [Mechercharimyces sp. CAU 1602]